MANNILSVLKEFTADQNNVKEFLGTPVTELSNYKPWMDNKDVSKFYDIVDGDGGKKKVVLKKSLTTDDFNVYNKDQNGNDLSSIDNEALTAIFNIATNRYNSEAGADDATGIQPISKYGNYDSINQLGLTKDVIGDYINVILDPDTPTDKIQSPAMNMGLARRVNGQGNEVFSDLSDTYLGSVKNYSINQSLMDSVSRSMFDTVVNVKKERQPMYVGSNMMPISPMSTSEVSNLYEQYKDDNMVKAADKSIKSMMRFNGGISKSDMMSTITDQLAGEFEESGALSASLATSIAMHQNGLGKYAPITMDNSEGEVKYTSTSSVEGIPVYDPKKGYFISTEKGDVPIQPDQLSDDIRKMAMDNNILQKGSGSYRKMGDMYANYGGRINIPSSMTAPSE